LKITGSDNGIKKYFKKIVRCTALIFCLSAISSSLTAQIGGRKSFEFLNVPASARLAALGGVNVSLADRDVNFFYANPALTGDTLTGFASANYQFYVGDIGHSSFTYATNVSTLGLIAFGVQHMGYGTIQGYDASGLETTEFNAGETAFLINKNHTIGNFRLGGTFKVVLSSIAAYNASAVAIDIGGIFIHPQQQLTVGLTIKNLGVIISEYSETSNSRLPLDVQLGATIKPDYMPVRFSLSAFNLLKPEVTYYNPADKKEKPGIVQKIFSHINIGSEILMHKNVNVLVGYNYLLHRELKLEKSGGGAGVSLGFSITLKSFDIVLSRNGYVAGSAGYSFTLSTNINKLTKRQQKL
jgi:hypothetical protein